MEKERISKSKTNIKLQKVLRYVVPILFIGALIAMIIIVSDYPNEMQNLFIEGNKKSLEENLSTACNITSQSAADGKDDALILAKDLIPLLDSSGDISDYAVSLMTNLRDESGYQNIGLCKITGSIYYSAKIDIDTYRKVDSWVFNDQIRPGATKIDFKTSPLSRDGGEVIVYRHCFKTDDDTQYMLIMERKMDQLINNLSIGSFAKNSATIFIHSDGTVNYQYGDFEEISFNFFEYLKDYADDSFILDLNKELYGSDPSGSFEITVNGIGYFFMYRKVSNTDFVCLKGVPQSSLVGETLSEVNNKTTTLVTGVSIIVLLSLFFIGYYVIRKLRESGEKKTEERDMLFRAMSAHTPTAYLIIKVGDPSPYFVSGNFKQIAGLPEEFVFEQETIVDWIGTRKELLNNIKDVNNIEFEIEKNERIFSVGVYRIGEFNNEIFHAIVLNDITKDKQVNELLKRTAENSERASVAKTEFLSKMSHEIRTPLNAILGFTNLALKNWESEDRDKIKDYIQKVDSSGNYLVGLVSDVLDVNRIEEGKLVITNRDCKLSHIVNEVGNTFEGQMAEKGVKFIVAKDYKDVDVSADKEHIIQILNNLISNAYKFTNAGGTVEFSTKVEVKTGRAFVKFIVKDNGIGMSDEFVSKIFSPFTQEYNKDLQGTYRGSGLGMSIVKSLVDTMGGTITVESKLKKGTKFIVGLALTIVEAKEETKEQKEIDTSKLNGKKILLVEDNELNREVARFTFEDYGIIFDEAENGQIGLEKFMASEPDEYFALFVDIRMPVMNGYDCAKSIRALDRADAKTVPIFAMTADASPDDISKTYMCGMNHHITKPIDPNKVIDYLMKYFN